MNKIVIRKVSVLQGMEKDIAEECGLEPEDLLIVVVSLEKIIGDPVEYLLSQIHRSEQEQTRPYEDIAKELGLRGSEQKAIE